MKRILLCLFLVVAVISCQKKLPQEIPSNQTKPPEDPLQRLAWDSAKQINQSRKSYSVKLGTINNEAKLPDSQLHYFRGALENELWQLKPGTETSTAVVSGVLSQANGQLQFLWDMQLPTEKTSGVSAVLWESPPPEISEEHHHDQMEMHQHHDVTIPTPVAQLQSIPLDVSQGCVQANEDCELLVLYDDSIERINWKTSNKRKISFPLEYFSQARSRAPSGKILNLDGTYIILQSNLTQPLKYDLKLDQFAAADVPPQIPRATPGLNIFSLMNGHFYDFEVLDPKGLAVIQEDQRLSIGAGTLITSNELVGGSLAVLGSTIYTSSNSLPGQLDSLLKFTYNNTSLTLQSTTQMDSEILDLAITDLNQDKASELLITIKRNGGIYIDVVENP
ncbi:hypothetical protein L0152_07635 [bacterium]|nr:hypothetical protein [bacterium]